jgi:tetratricopeptide (TPR) repeat protein
MCKQARFIGWKTSLVMLAMSKTLLLSSGNARAEVQQSASASEQDRSAVKLFEEAEAAYRNGDFIRAGEMFEEAYRQTPHPAPLWNAARSWSHAGEFTRAANAYAMYLEEAPVGTRDRDAAQSELAELKKKLGLVEIYTKDAEDVRLDDKPVKTRSVYVSPGKHVLEGRVGGVMLRQTETIEAGATRSMALVPPETAKPSPKLPPLSPIKTATLVPDKPSQGAWVMPLLIVWSGLDTQAARRSFDEDPTQDKLASGKDKQLRTNVLLGLSLGFGAATAGIISYWLGKPGADRAPAITLAPILPTHFSREFPRGLLVIGSF